MSWFRRTPILKDREILHPKRTRQISKTFVNEYTVQEKKSKTQESQILSENKKERI